MNKGKSKPNKIQEFFIKSAIGILKKVIPEANPDYDKQTDNVKKWLVEIDIETKLPDREIELMKTGIQYWFCQMKETMVIGLIIA